MNYPKVGKYEENYLIKPHSTHNTLPPFTSSLIKGPKCQLKAIKIVGKSHSPCMYVGGGIHGDEINGVAAVLRLVNETSPEDLNGSLILVPVQNPLGFLYRTRLNPYDPIDPDWVHSVRPGGNYSKKLKKILYDLTMNANCIIDLHTAGRGGCNNTMVYVPPETGKGKGIESLKLSMVFGGDQIIQCKELSDYGWPVEFALPFLVAREGKTGLYAESGEGGSTIPDEKSVDYFVTGVQNVMKELGIIEGNIEKQGKRLLIDSARKETQVYSSDDGVFIPKVNAGSVVEKGENLGSILRLSSGIFEIRAPVKGIIVWNCTFGSVGEKSRLFSIHAL